MKPLRVLVAEAFPGYPSLDLIPNVPVFGVECDSRKIRKDFIFVAVRGTRADGNLFIREALERGAVAVVSDRPQEMASQIPYLVVSDTRLAVARLAASFYNSPSKHLKIIGVTGTNGKTTSTFLLEHLLGRAGKKVGVIGTINYRFDGKVIPAIETTPGPQRLQALLSEMRDAHCEYAVMEVSAHALDQNRVEGIDFCAALFTNLTQDHLDYFGSMESYFESKASLFAGLAPEQVAVLNNDDPWVQRLKSCLKARVLTFGMREPSDVQAQGVQASICQTRLMLAISGRKIDLEIPLIGAHNVYNVLGALGVCRAIGLELEQVAGWLSDFPQVPGRLESIQEGQDFSVFVDYAHTPDGLLNVLASLAPYKKRKLIVVFGCGGERDRDKRPKMGKIASRWADFVYVTSDNPRSEDPSRIAEEVCQGFPEKFNRYAVTLDRRKAVREALLSARSGDIVVLAGKGHETTQVMGDKTLPFSDREEARRVLNGY